MYVLGINHWLHDSSVCLFRDGELVGAIEEERFYRDDKHTGVFPKRGIEFLLRRAEEVYGEPVEKIEHIGYNLDPLRAFANAEGTRELLLSPRRWSREYRKAHGHFKRHVERTQYQLRKLLRKHGIPKTFHFHSVDHHMTHAASAYFCSPFDEAAVLTIDGRGEWATTSYNYGKGNELTLLKSAGLPNSVGFVYGAFTEYLGFRRNNDEFKVMGLASYGDPERYGDVFEQMIQLTPEGGFELDISFFENTDKVHVPGPKMIETFGPRREPEGELSKNHMDVAAGLQAATDRVGLHMARYLREKTGADAICLAGGVALNCVMNWRILNDSGFDGVFVQPASYDAGCALGAALWVIHEHLGRDRCYEMKRVDLGPEFDNARIESVLKAGMLRYHKSEDVEKETAQLLRDGKIVGWFHGRAEFGPRALGHRSILADPTRPEMQDHVNNRVKHREDFRPFAPSVVAERYQEFFDTPCEMPFMTLVAPVREEYRDRLPAITHVDGTARLHTVREEVNPRYHRLLTEFGALSDIPILLNTSFNVRGEPMVLTPEDAIRCFFTTGIDILVLEDFIIEK